MGIYLNLLELHLKFMISMVTRVIRMVNFMGLLINKKYLMLLFRGLCRFVLLVNTEIMKLLNLHLKLMTLMILFLNRLENLRYMLYQERELCQNFILRSWINLVGWEVLINQFKNCWNKSTLSCYVVMLKRSEMWVNIYTNKLLLRLFKS